MATRTRASPAASAFASPARHAPQRLRRDGERSPPHAAAPYHGTNRRAFPTRPQLYSRSEGSADDAAFGFQARVSRVSADTCSNAARSRCRCADAPMGPVSIEIPIDVQGAAMDMPPFDELLPLRRASSRSTSVRSSHSRTNCAARNARCCGLARCARRVGTGARAREARLGVVTSAAAAVSCRRRRGVARFVHDVAAGRALYRTATRWS